METFWQFLMDISARHITPHGLYIPGEQYKLILWNELLVIILSFAMTIVVLKNRALKRLLARSQPRAYTPVHEPAHVTPGHQCMDKLVALEIVTKIAKDYNLVLIKYIDAAGNVTERNLELIDVYQREGRWYVDGFCWLRCEKRTFRVDRIIDIKPEYPPLTPEVGTNEGAEHPPVPQSGHG